MPTNGSAEWCICCCGEISIEMYLLRYIDSQKGGNSHWQQNKGVWEFNPTLYNTLISIMVGPSYEMNQKPIRRIEIVLIFIVGLSKHLYLGWIVNSFADSQPQQIPRGVCDSCSLYKFSWTYLLYWTIHILPKI